MYFGYAYKCHRCHEPIDKTKPYLVKKTPTKTGTVINDYFHPWCYVTKGRSKSVADIFLSVGNREPEVKIG